MKKLGAGQDVLEEIFIEEYCYRISQEFELQVLNYFV